ncbi:MAG: transcription termination factor Rho, partial [Dehalococcoidales bacterium]|nr:transcription termination factor Rho [Dehalococcoidales bacterium]
KRFFGAARNIEEGGSLTIVATCLVDTGSRMDDLIYEEFKGTGNMELHLDRKLAERGTFPAVDITRSSTRRDEFLYDKEEFTLTRILRRMVAAIATDQPNGGTTESSQRVIDSLKRTPNNKAFLESIIKDRKAV